MEDCIRDVGRSSDNSPRAKRFLCYHRAIARKFGILGYQQRRSTGWCFENKVRAAFSDSNKTGYKVIAGNITNEDDFTGSFDYSKF